MEFNNHFFEELSQSAPVSALCEAAAQEIAAIARSTAPEETGAYRDGIVVRKKFQKRVVWLVVGTDPKTMLVESKTGNLARALKTAAKRG